VNEFGTITQDFDTPKLDRARELGRNQVKSGKSRLFRERYERIIKSDFKLSGEPCKVYGGYDEMRAMVESGKL
jgi:hypothetical protein